MDGLIVAILGAGRAERFGGHKLDAALNGRPLGAWSLDAARALDAPVLFVTGPQAPAFLASEPGPPRVVTNPAPDAGMGSSVALAAAAARKAGARRLLLMLADMPFVSGRTLAALAAQASPGVASACRYGDGALGPPACFGADHLPLLEKLKGDAGARKLLKGAIEVREVRVEPVELFDVDTSEDLENARRLRPAG